MPSSSLAQRQVVDALISWLRTFPRMEGCIEQSYDIDTLLDDEEVATAILYIADEICDEAAAGTRTQDVKSIWRTISHLITSKMPRMLAHHTATVVERRILLLSALLCFAVSDKCRRQQMFVKRIVGMLPQQQKLLMNIIECGKAAEQTTPKSPRTPKQTPGLTIHRQATPTSASWPQEDLFVTPFAEHDCSFFHSPNETTTKKVFSPSQAFDTYIDKLIIDLREQNETLQQELDSTQQREFDLGRQLELSKEEFCKEMMRLESSSMRREEQVTDECQQEISRLESQVAELREANKELEEQGAADMNDQVDALQYTKETLAQTEDKLTATKERLEELAGAKEALLLKEEAHKESVEECHRLQKQLETYKTRVQEAEQELEERDESLINLHQIANDLERRKDELIEEAAAHREQVLDLRHELMEKEQQLEMKISEATSDTDDGVFEASREENTRLRRENMQLRAYLAEVEQQSQSELNVSQENVVEQQARVEELARTVKMVRYELEETNSQLIESRDNLSKTSNRLQVTQAKYDALEMESKAWKQQAEDARMFSARRRELLDTIQKNAKDVITCDAEKETLLQKEIARWMQIANDSETSLDKCMNDLLQTKLTLDSVVTSLDTALERENDLNDRIVDLEKSKRDLEATLKAEGRAKAEALKAAERTFKRTREDMEEREKAELNELRESANSLTALLHKERTDHQEQVESLKETYEQRLAKAKQEAEAEQARLEDEHSKHIASITKTDHEERERLVEAKEAATKELELTARNDLLAVEREVDKLAETLNVLRNEYAAGKEKADCTIRSHKNQLKAASKQVKELEETKQDMTETIKSLEQMCSERQVEVIELSQTNDRLTETVDAFKSDLSKLQEDNDRFLSQVDERFTDYTEVQDQLETLKDEYTILLEENQGLRRGFAKVNSLQKCVVSAISGSTEVFNPKASYRRDVFYGRKPSELRKEFEVKVEALTEEKRKLVVRSNAAITDLHKAEKRAWEADQEVSKLRKKLRAARVAQNALELALKESLSHDETTSTLHSETKENENGLEVVTFGGKALLGSNAVVLLSPLSEQVPSPRPGPFCGQSFPLTSNQCISG